MRVSPKSSATLVLVQDLTQPSLKPYRQLQTPLLLPDLRPQVCTATPGLCGTGDQVQGLVYAG